MDRHCIGIMILCFCVELAASVVGAQLRIKPSEPAAAAATAPVEDLRRDLRDLEAKLNGLRLAADENQAPDKPEPYSGSSPETERIHW